MSITVSLSGDTSSLCCQFFPPISLSGSWEIGLLNLETFHSIPNIHNGVVKIGGYVQKTKYKESKLPELVPDDDFPYEVVKNTEKTIHIPTGSYEIDDITNYINRQYEESIISFYGNRNTLKTEVTVKNANKFVEVNAELAEVMGIKNGGYTFYTGKEILENPTKITQVNVVRINCNIAQSSYLNGKPTHTIHEFFPNVPPGFRIIEVPNTIIYHSINTNSIEFIQLDLIDQNNRLIDFRGEVINIRLHLRQLK